MNGAAQAMERSIFIFGPTPRSCISFFFFSSRRRHTRSLRDWSSDVCSSDLMGNGSLKSTTPDGKSVVSKWAPGDTRFNPRDRVHTETLVEGQLRAIITELK